MSDKVMPVDIHKHSKLKGHSIYSAQLVLTQLSGTGKFKLHIHITEMIIKIFFKVFENWSICIFYHFKIARSDFLSFTSKQQNRM